MASASPHSSRSSAARTRAITAIGITLGAALVGYLIFYSLTHTAAPKPPQAPPMWGLGTIPFIAILGAIALLPLIPATHHWWESNRNRLIVSLVCASATVIYFFFAQGMGKVVYALEHAIVDEYIPFIVLLFSLYVISGGINVRGAMRPTPTTNTAFLAIGALIASFVGTTGASMLLIRPLLQTNSERRYVTHTVVFFIFLVSNIGGCLLPIGDPPLFLGYLRGVPFLWTFVLWKEWLFCCIILLALYWVWDTIVYKRENLTKVPHADALVAPQKFSIRGSINFVLLILVVLEVWQLVPGKTILGFTVFPFMRELAMLGMVAISLWFTPQFVREDNRFNYTAILEVAALFIGIFITMQVPIQVLNVMGGDLGLSSPTQFFWTTGILSSVLDNAPTYVVFFETANALTTEEGPGIIQMLDGRLIREDQLIGISLGAVFMGANTYIGNGPNFMVKSIAEQSGVRMPGFFGYVIRYTIPILIPLFVLVAILFL